jgi:class 3 adenylate cyclase
MDTSSGAASFGYPRSQAEFETAVRRLIDEGQPFTAYDLATEALTAFPDSVRLRQSAALALIRTGAADRAKALLEPLCAGSALPEGTYDSLCDEFSRMVSAAARSRRERPGGDEMRAAIKRFLGVLVPLSAHAAREGDADEETLGLLARVHKTSWLMTGEPADAKRALDLYLRGFTETGGYYTGINAATLMSLAGNGTAARQLAQRVLEVCDAELKGFPPLERAADPAHVLHMEDRRREALYWLLATQGEAWLLLGDEKKAVKPYRKAAAVAGRSSAWVVSSLQQLRLLVRNGIAVPAELFNVLRPPTVVVFTGHMMDRPGRPSPRFPGLRAVEAGVRREIDRTLDSIDARIGYCSAACGSDIIFIEAMVERGGEVNIVLPFTVPDFIRESVQFAGQQWLPRFHRAVRLAQTVKNVTTEKFLDSRQLFSFANLFIRGLAHLRAETLATRPELVAVLDQSAKSASGGTADAVSVWRDRARLHVIALDEIRRREVPENAAAGGRTRDRGVRSSAPARTGRLVRTMLFADVVGYSRLQEEHTPSFVHKFLTHIAVGLKRLKRPPPFINTWGDAIFAVMDGATPMAECALQLKDLVSRLDLESQGLPPELTMRIALHAGPVYEGRDPITGRRNYYGFHVNKAARLEPVTVPGRVYASEQFAAMLTAEQAAVHKSDLTKSRYACEYVGIIKLPKASGAHTVYHLRRKTRHEMARAPIKHPG